MNFHEISISKLGFMIFIISYDLHNIFLFIISFLIFTGGVQLSFLILFE